MTLGVSGSQALWFTTRATGMVALVLLTLTVVLGVLTTIRFQSPSWPRFALALLHRRVSLITLVFLAIHVVSTVLDSFAPIGWISVLVPFTSPYRRLWLGMGTIAFDLLLAVGISSLLRQRLNPRTWRAVHWLSYAVWPVAVVHALGTGTDPRLHWVLLVTVACVAAVAVAVGWRLVSGWPGHAARRLSIGATATVGVVGVAAWAAVGPLQPGWAARAGTPSSLLGGHANPGHPVAGAGSPVPSGTGPATSSAPSSGTSLPVPPFQATFRGTLTRRLVQGGLEEIDLSAQSTTGVAGVLAVSLIGTPDGSGGIMMQQGQGSFGPSGSPTALEGAVVGLDGSRIVLSVHDAAGSEQTLALQVTISGSSITGELVVRAGGPAGGGGGGR